MKILMAASEMAPYAKTGGLGDVLGALPKALANRDCEVVVCIPHYRSLLLDPAQATPLGEDITVDIGGQPTKAQIAVYQVRRQRFKIVLIKSDKYFGRDALYVDPKTGTDYPDNDERFEFFAKATLLAARAMQFKPDIVHVHDWQTALIPALLKMSFQDDPYLGRVKSVLTVHNLAHQGLFEAETFQRLGFPERLFGPGQPFEFWKKVNYLKAGIVYADKVTTVSPRYATEIQTEKFGAGLDGVLRSRAKDLVGILNGVDYTVWSPSRDRRIPFRYHINNLGGKKKTRVELMNELGLPIRENVPLLGIVSRLAHQKGFDLIKGVAEKLFGRDIQMAVLGTGDAVYHQLFEDLEGKYPDKIKCFFRLDEDLAHMIEAGSDMFLMPSLFEPCGLNQIYSLKYGTVPIVHHVGGLADTIDEFDPESREGNGFVFTEETPEAFLAAIDRALGLFNRKRLWTRLMKNGMRQDFSWSAAVDSYLSLYEQISPH